MRVRSLSVTCSLFLLAPAVAAQLPVTEVELAQPGGWRVLLTPDGVYRQAAGATVQQATALVGSSATLVAQGLAIDPFDADNWLVGTKESAGPATVFKLSNAGASAPQALGIAATGGAFVDFAFSRDPGSDTVLAAFDGYDGQEGLWRSDDRGKNWTPIDSTKDYGIVEVEFDPLVPNRAIAMDGLGYTTTSNDGGATWTPLATLTPFLGALQLLEASPHHAGRLYASETGAGLWRSDSFGASWTLLGGTGFGERALFVSPNVPDTLWVVDDLNRIYMSCSAGVAFGASVDNYSNYGVPDLDLDPATGELLIASEAWGLIDTLAGVVALGAPTVGSGGFAPRIYLDGILAPGNSTFALRGDRLLGGATVFQRLSGNEVSVPLAGGTWHVGAPFPVQFLATANGVPGSNGVPGKGQFTRTIPVPANPAITGSTYVTQFIAADPGVPSPTGWVVSGGLRLRGQP